MTNQSPAEDLREQLTSILLVFGADYSNASNADDVNWKAEALSEAPLPIMELVTAYAATVEREALERLKGWIDRNHYQPVNESDRWVQASGEIMQEIDARLAALQGPQEEPDEQ